MQKECTREEVKSRSSQTPPPLPRCIFFSSHLKTSLSCKHIVKCTNTLFLLQVSTWLFHCSYYFKDLFLLVQLSHVNDLYVKVKCPRERRWKTPYICCCDASSSPLRNTNPQSVTLQLFIQWALVLLFTSLTISLTAVMSWTGKRWQLSTKIIL